MTRKSETSDLDPENSSPSLKLRELTANEHGKETLSMPPEVSGISSNVQQKGVGPSGALRGKIFLICITLTQLVQMIPLGVGINSGLALGKALGASSVESVWIVASYPLTQGSFVLIGNFFLPLDAKRTRQTPSHSFIRWSLRSYLRPQSHALRWLRVVGCLGVCRWLFEQSGRTLHHEGFVRDRWWAYDSKHCGLDWYYLPTR